MSSPGAGRRAGRGRPGARRTAGNPGLRTAWRSGRPEVPVRVLGQLLVSLVRRVERLEEGDRVGDVDDHRQVELRGGRPEWVEPLVVDGHEPAGGIARSQPKHLPDLEPACAAGGRIAQPCRLDLTERRVGRPAVVVEPGEHDEAVGCHRLPALDLVRQAVTLAAVEIDERFDPRLVERREELGRRALRPPSAERGSEVVVGVDDREARPKDFVARDAEDRPRPVVGQADHAGSRRTTWPRCRGASGSRPRTRARVRASAWAG